MNLFLTRPAWGGALLALAWCAASAATLPAQAQTLIDVHRLRCISAPYGVVKVDAAPGVIQITFRANPPFDSMRIIELIQKNRHIKLAGNEKLRIERALPEVKDRVQLVRDTLRSLGQPIKTPEVA